MKLLFLCIFLAAQFSFALNPEEQQPGEPFPSYFARLTRGGSFPGIYLKAPDKFAEIFHQYIRKNYWMGPVQKAERKLTEKGFDLWFDVYRTDIPQKYFIFTQSFADSVKNYCGQNLDYTNTKWRDWPTCLRRAWIDEVLFSQGTAVQLAMLYGLDINEVRSRAAIYLLHKDEFEKKVREAGWGGPIYFRGATFPDPQDPSKRWIILNEEFLKQYTSFEYPILQLLELAGIANHELSHVMQDMLGQKNNLDIQVRSAEQALLIEGQAEYMAELSFKKTGVFFELFAAQQAVEVVNREGNMAEMFPYTIGVPFVTTLYETQKDFSQVTLDLLTLLGRDLPLEAYLKKYY